MQLAPQSAAFAAAEPAVPPELILYTCGYSDFGEFLRSGQEVKLMFDLALANHCSRSFADFEHVLEFGCGCGRLIRHVAAPNLFGCDIHRGCVTYCQGNLAHASFYRNSEHPPLIYRDGLFDLVYSFSVFSHLDLESETEWLNELTRIGAPGCVYLLTVHGDWMIEATLGEERSAAEAAGFYFRSVHQRHGCDLDFPASYEASYHTSRYIRDAWNQHFEIVAVIKGDSPANFLIAGQAFEPTGMVPLIRPMGQDLVIGRKRS